MKENIRQEMVSSAGGSGIWQKTLISAAIAGLFVLSSPAFAADEQINVGGSNKGSPYTFAGGDNSANVVMSGDAPEGKFDGSSADMTGTFALDGTSNTLDVAADAAGSGNITISGVIDGTGTLEKTGTGTLTLGGDNTYEGNTVVRSGTLELTGGGGITGSSGLTLYNGTTFVNGGRGFSLDNKILEVKGGKAAYTGNLSARNATLKFDMAGAKQGDTLLAVGGNADVTGSTVGLDNAKGALALGEQVNLINSTGMTGSVNQVITVEKKGATDYNYNIATEGDALTATYNKTVNQERARGYTYGAAAKAAMLNNAVDHSLSLIDHWDYQGRGKSAEGGKGFSSFASVQGSSVKTRTGSSVDNDGVSFLLGGAYDRDGTVIGVYAEGGIGSYNAYSSFGNSDGDTWHYGLGVFGKQRFDGGFYADGSLRAGRVKADYSGAHDMAYSGQNWYWGAHAGLGYEYALSANGAVDSYAKVIWTQQESNSMTTKAGEKLSFDSTDSVRSRIGSRYIHTADNGARLWGGLAWEYEFDGESSASVDGTRIRHDNELKGHSALAEAGIEWNACRRWTMNAGISGMLGAREGVVGNFTANYKF